MRLPFLQVYVNNIIIYQAVGRAVTHSRSLEFEISLWSERSEVQISGRLNRIQCYQRLATAAAFL